MVFEAHAFEELITEVTCRGLDGKFMGECVRGNIMGVDF